MLTLNLEPVTTRLARRHCMHWRVVGNESVLCGDSGDFVLVPPEQAELMRVCRNCQRVKLSREQGLAGSQGAKDFDEVVAPCTKPPPWRACFGVLFLNNRRAEMNEVLALENERRAAMNPPLEPLPLLAMLVEQPTHGGML